MSLGEEDSAQHGTERDKNHRVRRVTSVLDPPPPPPPRPPRSVCPRPPPPPPDRGLYRKTPPHPQAICCCCCDCCCCCCCGGLKPARAPAPQCAAPAHEACCAASWANWPPGWPDGPNWADWPNWPPEYPNWLAPSSSVPTPTPSSSRNCSSLRQPFMRCMPQRARSVSQ